MNPTWSLLEMLAAASAMIWLAILLLPWQPWRNNEVLPLPPSSGAGAAGNGADDLSDTTVVIPARNEAHFIGATLGALVGQGRGLRVLVVDDNSTDGTADAARAVQGLDLRVIPGQPLPEGWAGKVWALAQGVRHVETRLTLFIDADVTLGPGVVPALRAQMRGGGYGLASVMASLRMESFWEKLLAPSFIYFFKLLYPFRLARTKDPRFYAAAGGCLMLETRAIAAIGGMESIRGELIDDCALARQVKRAGFRTWIGQSRAVESVREYGGLREIWNMVARSAYTQLRYSPLILLAVMGAMTLMFLMPVAGVFAGEGMTRGLSALAWAAMAASYLPTLLFYGLSPFWALLMPLAGALYVGMTWSSALRYGRGAASMWKGRVYQPGR
jgi:hopene-associated glycosyltransferase HpnB